jgi:hypothetical protein
MTFSEGKLPSRPLSRGIISGPSECPGAASLARAHHPHRRRKRRYHIAQQALGYAYDSYDVAASSLPPPQPATETPVTQPEPETISDQDVRQQLALNGMRTCAWVLLGVLLGIHFKEIVAICYLAVHALRGP